MNVRDDPGTRLTMKAVSDPLGYLLKQRIQRTEAEPCVCVGGVFVHMFVC